MPDVICPECGSENVFFSKKRQIYVCEDCEHTFDVEIKSSKRRKIFFSYAHDENEWLVSKFRKDLENRGFEIWIDRSKIKSGDDWRRTITEGLLESDGVVAFLSKHSVRVPGVCLDEIRIAFSVKGGNIRTVLMESENDVIPPSSISGIQWLDLSSWTSEVCKIETWQAWYDSKLDELQKSLERDDFSSFSGDIETINKTLNVVVTDSKEHLLVSKPYFGRKWLGDMVENWRSTDTDSQVLIIYGAPGLGKSAFVANQLHFNSHVLCGFFCEWDKESQKDPKNISKALAFKLSTQLPDYRKILLSRLEGRGTDYLKALTASETFEQLIVQPLSELIDGGRDRQIIFVDGLDEADTGGSNEFARILSESAKKLPKWIGLVITSRPEGNIRRYFSGYSQLECSTVSDKNDMDIQEYILECLGEELSVSLNKEQLISGILSSCEGNFLYATMFAEAVKKKSIDINDVSNYPKGLDAIHLQNFKRAFPDISAYSIPRRILEVLVASDGMPFDLVCKTADVNRYDFITFREDIGSLLVESVDPVGIQSEQCKSYSFCHKSVQDWLTDQNKSGRFYVDAESGCKRASVYFHLHIKKQPVPDEAIRGLTDYTENYVRNHLIEFWQKNSEWQQIEQFLLEDDTPLLPYWKCIDDFPDGWNTKNLLNTLWDRSDCNEFFNTLQRSGERKLVSDILEELNRLKGIGSFNRDLFETYVDIVHLGGGYKKAVHLYENYLSGFSSEELFADPSLLHYNIRRIHHSMFFAPVKDLINEAVEVFQKMDPEKTPKDYNEILFLIGGNLGVLSGDFDFAERWLKKAESFAHQINDKDFQSRAARKKADLLCVNGRYSDALSLIQEFVNIDSYPKTRYEIYLIGALAETYRQMAEYDKSEYAYRKLLDITQTKGLVGWQCHAFLGLSVLLISDDLNKTDEAIKNLQSAKKIYTNAEQAWGIVNSSIVEGLLKQYTKTFAEKDYEALLDMKQYSEKLQYSYETSVLNDLTNGRLSNNYRLLFL